MFTTHHLTLTLPPSSSSSSSLSPWILHLLHRSHSRALSALLSLIFKVADGITSSTMRQMGEICICSHTCAWLCERAWLLPGIITVWGAKGRVGLTAVQGRAGCRCNIFLSIFISFRLPGWLEALTGIYCHLTRLHLLCFTAQHAGWAIPFQMDWMSLWIGAIKRYFCCKRQ